MENFNNEAKQKVVRACIENNEYSLIDLLQHWQKDIDFDLLDQTLLHYKKYNIYIKIQYATIFKRNFFLKALITDIKNNYMQYDYQSILYVATHHLKSEKKRSFYLLEAFAKVEEDYGANFRYSLEQNEVLEEFKKALMLTPSTLLKIKASVYLDPTINCDLFKNKTQLITAIKTSRLSSKEKLKYFLDLSRNVYLTIDEIEHLKNALIEIASSYKTKLDKQLAELDEELLDVNQILYDHDLAGSLRELNDRTIKEGYIKK